MHLSSKHHWVFIVPCFLSSSSVSVYISGHILTVKSPAAFFPFSAFYRLSLFSGPAYLTPPALYLLLFPLSERKAYTPYQWNISLDLSGGRLFSLGVSCPCFIHQTGPVYLPAKEQWGAQIIRNERWEPTTSVLRFAVLPSHLFPFIWSMFFLFKK